MSVGVVIAKARDNDPGELRAPISFLDPVVCHTSGSWSTAFDLGNGSTRSRPRSSSDCAEVHSLPRVAGSGMSKAEPPVVRRSRTVHSRSSAKQSVELGVERSGTSQKHREHIPSPSSGQKLSVPGKVPPPDLGLPGTSVQPHKQDSTVPLSLTQSSSLPKLTAAKGFLQCYWNIPGGIYYFKRTPIALKNYTQRTFEMLVTAGYLLEDAKGFWWVSSGEYELFKCREDALTNLLDNTDRASSAYSHCKHLHPVIASVTSGQLQEQAPAKAGSSLYERRAATRKSSILRVCTPRYPWNEDEPDCDYVAIFPRWTFPEVEDEKGLLIARSDQYKLLRVSDIADHEPMDVPNKFSLKIKCPKCEKKKSKGEKIIHCDGRELSYDIPLLPPQIIQSSSTHPSPPGTPIVKEDSFMTETPKLERRATSLLDLGLGRPGPRTRFNASSTSLDSTGVLNEERLTENGEKWGRMRRKHAEKRKKEKEENMMVKATMARLNGIAWTHPFAAKE
ncbi:hypothetical protein BKA63DRAFT_557241 [Paraphoma chrysanthemicola]|nr:hypothetical protein BKA63DRAFT_557241 [Paraphoma chrysanthemicola]